MEPECALPQKKNTNKMHTFDVSLFRTYVFRSVFSRTPNNTHTDTQATSDL
jgi:hypothetical protein